MLLIAPDGRAYTVRQVADLFGTAPASVWSQCYKRRRYKGYEVVRDVAVEKKEDKAVKLRLGTDEITMSELYDAYCWCHDSPEMLTIMKDISCMSVDLLNPIIKSFEERRQKQREAKRLDEA